MRNQPLVSVDASPDSFHTYSLPRGDGKNDVAQQILSVCDTYCYYKGISGCGVNPQMFV